MLDISSSHRHPVLEEHDYIGLSQASLAGAMAPASKDVEGALQETDLGLDLGLGLGLSSGFAKREAEAEWKGNQGTPQLDSSHSIMSARLGLFASKNWMKRGFTETTATPTPKASEIDSGVPNQSSFFPTLTPSKQAGGLEKPGNVTSRKPFTSAEIHRAPVPEDAPPAKDRVVGWPPVRSYRRQTLTKPAELYVKVNMDGMTVGRKVDLNAYTCYESLLVALEDMFQPSSNSQATPQASLRMDSDIKHFLLANGSDFVLTYEDKDGDWMLVGDVPWSMFVSTVRRLRIMRGLEATGSGSRALGK